MDAIWLFSISRWRADCFSSLVFRVSREKLNKMLNCFFFFPTNIISIYLLKQIKINKSISIYFYVLKTFFKKIDFFSLN
jgi:hypothetical protein